jgi:hypothetical protein
MSKTGFRRARLGGRGRAHQNRGKFRNQAAIPVRNGIPKLELNRCSL